VKLSVPLNPASGVYVSVPSPLSTTAPLAGCANDATMSATPSTSVSLASKLAFVKVSGVSCEAESTSALATGPSFVPVTVIVTVFAALRPPSLSVAL
jgi:hypothetical protein